MLNEKRDKKLKKKYTETATKITDKIVLKIVKNGGDYGLTYLSTIDYIAKMINRFVSEFNKLNPGTHCFSDSNIEYLRNIVRSSLLRLSATCDFIPTEKLVEYSTTTIVKLVAYTYFLTENQRKEDEQ